MIGKVNDDFFRRAILPHTGAAAPQLVVGPQMGVDAAVLKIGEEYLVVAEDPIFPGPTMSPDDFGWITVHIGASDVAVMGVRPRFMTYSLLLPPDTPESYIAELVKSISLYAAELGITIAGGHTGFYGAVNVPTIGGITVWGLGREFVTPAGARVGDDVIITKGAAIEGAALLACELEEKLLAAGIEPGLVERAKKRLREMSVVAEAGIAMETGGVHAMHDATEGGLARGLWEVAEASGVGLKIERSRVPVPEDVRAVCAHFDLNPYEIISEGTLVLACAPEKTGALLAALQEAGLEGAVIGRVIPGTEGRFWVEDDGQQVELVPPPADRFWDVFFNALALKNDNRTAAELALCRELGEAVRELQAADIIAALIPEIGANLAYCLPEARDLKDVAAIPGRLLRFKGQVAALGEPEMGCSKHMGGTILVVREFFPAARCVINLRYSPRIHQACAGLGLKVASMPVPAGYRQEDAEFYRDLRQTLAGCRELPDVIEIPDRLNLERLILVLGKNPAEIVAKVKALAARM
ncbi:thiamine-phosphate synthase family protein [Moorella sulfitireducens]|uniref:thiamine-phosphate synthase family protein n=1 Tax=Neomoorella sulfitireducens TaxID=2972948 RepID=UPI0021ABFB64|nr:thiamine-phosphate synthase family protein [Moorella sulfitireducens]